MGCELRTRAFFQNEYPSQSLLPILSFPDWLPIAFQISRFPFCETPKEQHALDAAIIARVELSIECPITVTIGTSRYRIGNKEEFLYRRLALQAAQQRVQNASPYNRAGHGRKRKLKAAQQYAEAEKQYVANRLHVYSRRLIDHCVKHRTGTLVLVQQQAKEAAAKEDPFLLRNWSYYQLKEKIRYKAEKVGILLTGE